MSFSRTAPSTLAGSELDRAMRSIGMRIGHARPSRDADMK
jgi:hypothetical protein